MTDLAVLQAQLRQSEDRAADLADDLQCLLLIRELSQEAVNYMTSMAAYTGTPLPGAISKLAEGLRVLKLKVDR